MGVKEMYGSFDCGHQARIHSSDMSPSYQNFDDQSALTTLNFLPSAISLHGSVPVVAVLVSA